MVERRSEAAELGLEQSRACEAGNAVCSCHPENFLTQSQLFDAPAGISGSRLPAAIKNRLCRGTRRPAVSLWHFCLSVFESLFLISTTVCLN